MKRGRSLLMEIKQSPSLLHPLFQMYLQDAVCDGFRCILREFRMNNSSITDDRE